MAEVVEIWERLDAFLTSVDGASAELGPPATDAQIALCEAALSISFPPDFQQSLRCHNGAGGILFIVGEYRLWSIDEIIKLNKKHRSLLRDNEFSSGDISGRVKDLIYNPLWISIGDNGGNSGIAIDLDPGEKGSLGQILGLYEDETVVLADSFTAFLGHVVDEIESGARAWDAAAGQWSDPNNHNL